MDTKTKACLCWLKQRNHRLPGGVAPCSPKFKHHRVRDGWRAPENKSERESPGTFKGMGKVTGHIVGHQRREFLCSWLLRSWLLPLCQCGTVPDWLFLSPSRELTFGT